MADHLDSFRFRHQQELNSEELDRKLIELSALFEISQTLNSSLNLKSILDNLLFVTMGRMMISKGMILFQVSGNPNIFKIETVKGLPFSLINKELHIGDLPNHPVFIKEIDTECDWLEPLHSLKIDLLIPLISMRNFRGFIAFGSKLLNKAYTDDELGFLSSMTNIAIPAIENALVFEELNTVNRQLDQKIQELNTLFEIGKELNQIFDAGKILKQLSYSLMGQMLVNQFFIAQKSDHTLQIVYRKGSFFTEENLQRCMDFCNALPDLTSPVIVDEDNEPYTELFDLGIRVIVPMENQGDVKGFIFLGPKLDKSPFTKSNMAFLSTLANMAIIALENARLFEETLEKKRMEEELNLAKSIQRQLLPNAMPALEHFDIHGLNIPSTQVGGDYFDIIELSETEYILTIADVSGKGMPASLLMSNLQAALLTLCNEKQYSLSEVTANLNNLIHRNTSIEKYITFFIARLNTKRNNLEYVNAGHNPPYLFHADGTHVMLDKGGIILGMMPDVQYDTGTQDISPGDRVMMFTDGVTEAMSPEEVPFDEERVIDFLRNCPAGLCSEEINNKLIDALYKFAGDPTKDDDITILTVQMKRA